MTKVKNYLFGAIVSLDNNDIENTGIVGDEGRVYLAGIPEKGKLIASWGKNNSCQVIFNNIQQSDKNQELYLKRTWFVNNAYQL